MLDFEDTLFICSPLLTFVSSVASVGGGRTVRWCMRVENSDIKKVDLFAFVPNILSLDVKSCTFLGIGASEGETLSSQRLESGFYTDVRAYLCEKLCSSVSDSIMSDGRHGKLRAAERMADTKWLARWAMCG